MAKKYDHYILKPEDVQHIAKAQTLVNLQSLASASDVVKDLSDDERQSLFHTQQLTNSVMYCHTPDQLQQAWTSLDWNKVFEPHVILALSMNAHAIQSAPIKWLDAQENLERNSYRHVHRSRDHALGEMNEDTLWISRVLFSRQLSDTYRWASTNHKYAEFPLKVAPTLWDALNNSGVINNQTRVPTQKAGGIERDMRFIDIALINSSNKDLTDHICKTTTWDNTNDAQDTLLALATSAAAYRLNETNPKTLSKIVKEVLARKPNLNATYQLIAPEQTHDLFEAHFKNKLFQPKKYSLIAILLSSGLTDTTSTKAAYPQQIRQLISAHYASMTEQQQQDALKDLIAISPSGIISYLFSDDASDQSFALELLMSTPSNQPMIKSHIWSAFEKHIEHNNVSDFFEGNGCATQTHFVPALKELFSNEEGVQLCQKLLASSKNSGRYRHHIDIEKKSAICFIEKMFPSEMKELFRATADVINDDDVHNQAKYEIFLNDIQSGRKRDTREQRKI